jgi:hypothetical protein
MIGCPDGPVDIIARDIQITLAGLPSPMEPR